MILTIDTSTPTCKISFSEGDWRYESSWEAGRELARGLLSYLQNELTAQQKSWSDLTGIVVFRGPGSFTGLRIGVTVANSLAYSRNVPIVGELGEDWAKKGISRILAGESDDVVMPEYGGEANITAPRK